MSDIIDAARKGVMRGARKKMVYSVAEVIAATFLASLFIPLPGGDFSKVSVHSLRVVDRNGILLREFLNDRQGRGQWRELGKISPYVREATIAVEDRRFRYHPGIDPIAVLRAAWGDVSHASFRSGGSGITQQVIRNVYHHPRTLWSKVVEAWYSLRLERMFSKDDILEQYLNRAPYGNQLTGIEAASRYYFQKSAANLSLAEAAFLASLPNAPSALNPYRNMAGVLRRQQGVLKRMLDQSRITKEEYSRAVSQPVELTPPQVNFRAPHAVETALQQLPSSLDIAEVRTTIDAPLQQEIEMVVRNDLALLRRRNVTNAAVVVTENTTGAVRVLIGSADYFDEAHDGQVNGALALRQPGSSVKPFTYAIAFESGLTPSVVLADLPVQIPDHEGEYVPENYDRRYHGPVRVRTALACSYNIPAVRVLQSVGVGRLHGLLQSAGITSLTQPPSYYGYGLTLGNADVRLIEFTNAYAAIARGGIWRPAVLVEQVTSFDDTGRFAFASGTAVPAHQILDARAAFLVADILSDPEARRPAFGNAFRFPFACAIKTGTTKDYRDNWTMGFTPEYTVGVWVGNFDGTAMRGVSGIAGAGSIFYDVMMTLFRDVINPDRQFDVPRGVERRTVCSLSGLIPGPWCRRTIREWFMQERLPKKLCDVHRKYGGRDENGVITEHIYQVLPPEYSEWMREQRIPRVPAGAIPVEQRAPKFRNFALISPANGEIFKLDPVLRREYQAVRIQAAVPAGYSKVKLVVNDGEVYPYADGGIWWELKKGTHRFRLEALAHDRPRFSNIVTINVE